MGDLYAEPAGAAQKMLDLLPGELHWCRGTRIDYACRGPEPDVSRCLVGAACEVLGADLDATSAELDGAPLIHALAGAVAAEYPDRWLRGGFRQAGLTQSLERFNDNPRTTYADVRRVVEKVASG